MERETPQPEKSVEEQIARTYREWWPGKMGWSPGSNASGCAVKTFLAADFEQATDDLNEWFRVNTAMQVVQIDALATNDYVGFYVIYTKTISPEQMAQYDRVEAKAMQLIAEEDAAAEQQKALQEELSLKAEKDRKALELAAEKEKNRLAELGRVHEKNCSKKGKK